MSLSKQIIFTLALLSIYVSAQTSSEEEILTEILCSVNFPTRPDFCNAIYTPVCASYPRVCVTTPCPQVQTFASNCLACQDPNVESYRPGGVCPGDEEVVVIGDEESFEGIIVEEEGGLQDEETILVEDDNEESPSSDFYLSVLCNDPRPDTCTDQYDPVCVTECADAACRKTASNACTACSDQNVLVYTPQSCEAERIQCPTIDLTATDIICSDIWNPVCSYSKDCTGNSCGITSPNECNACSIQGADYYIRGECPGSVIASDPSAKI